MKLYNLQGILWFHHMAVNKQGREMIFWEKSNAFIFKFNLEWNTSHWWVQREKYKFLAPVTENPVF